jgi:hypothetical protein
VGSGARAARKGEEGEVEKKTTASWRQWRDLGLGDVGLGRSGAGLCTRPPAQNGAEA